MILIGFLVSIIIPAYNAEQTIRRAIKSCLNQSHQDIEIIIVDNHSTDKTADLIHSQTDPRIRYVYSEKKGRSLARNIGLQKARGSYIQFLDADDELGRTKIEIAVMFLEKQPTYKGYVAGVRYVKDGEEVAKVWPKLHYSNELLAHNIFPIHAILFRKNNTVAFDTEIDYCEDWLFWVQELHGQRLYFDETNIAATVHIHENNTMGQRERMNEYQLYVQQKIKEIYPVTSVQLSVNEFKLLIIHYFTVEKEKITVDIIKKISAKRYRLVSILLKVPLVKQFAQKKAIALAEKNLY